MKVNVFKIPQNNVFAKAETDPSGLVLDYRHTMLDDSDINHTRMARAVVGAVVASKVSFPQSPIKSVRSAL